MINEGFICALFEYFDPTGRQQRMGEARFILGVQMYL